MLTHIMKKFMGNEVSLLFIKTKDERNSKVFFLEINWYAMNLSTI